MKYGVLCLSLMAYLLSAFILFPQDLIAEEGKPSTPDKALCAKMIGLGKQSYQMGKYLDAKEYFRQAVKADPSSTEAWKHYDLAVIYALAEKVNKNSGVIAPEASAQNEGQSAAASVPPPPQAPAPAKKPKFVIVEDEGC